MTSPTVSLDANGDTGRALLSTPEPEAAGPAVLPTCRFPRALSVKGKLEAKEDVVIEGRFDGEIDLPDHCLTIQAEAHVQATIFARDVTIHGSFIGRLTATEIVDIRDTASVAGTVKARRILLGEHAAVRARLETRRRMEAAAHVARYRRERSP